MARSQQDAGHVPSARNLGRGGGGCPQEPNGFIVVATLWMLMLLAFLATVYSVYLSKTAIALSANDLRIETDAIVSASLELAAYQLILPAREKRPATGEFRTRIGGADVRATFAPETARIDLNAAPKPLISALFGVLGASTQNADFYADRIVGWRTEPDAQSADEEASRYRAAGLAYAPRGAPFAHTSELWLVQGLPPALVERALRFVTVYSGQPNIQTAGAAPEVIAALPGTAPGRVSSVLARRGQGAAPSDADASGSGQPGTTTDPGDTFRVLVRMSFAGGRTTASEVVLLINNDVNDTDAPYHVLAWNDDVELAADQSRGIR